MDGRLEESQKNLETMRKNLDSLVKRRNFRMSHVDEHLNSQCTSMLYYLYSK